VSNFLDKLKKTGTIERRPGSGQLRTVRTESNVNAVDELVLSQEDAPQTHHTFCQISRATGISQTSVMRIIHSDLRLKCLKKRRAQQLTAANRLAHLTRSKQLLRNFSSAEVDFIFFSDEKVFSVAPPVKLAK